MIPVLALIFWLLLTVLQTLRFHAMPRFSDFERERLVKKGDDEARTEAKQLEIEPLLESFRFVVMTLVGVLMVTTLVTAYQLPLGITLGLVGLLLAPSGRRIGIICRMADKLAMWSRPYATKAALTLKPVLVWLRERDSLRGSDGLHSQPELIDLLRRSSDVVTSDELQRLEASLAFDNHVVSDIMTPRSVIEAVNASDTLGPLVLDDLHKTGHSRFPVYEGDIDHVVGMLYLHDLVLKSMRGTIKSAMKPKVYYIHEAKDLSHALHAFLRTHHHLFIVVNDYRETVGLLSLEDVLETLLGKKIIDEFDQFDDLRAVAESNPHKNNQPKGKTDL